MERDINIINIYDAKLGEFKSTDQNSSFDYMHNFAALNPNILIFWGTCILCN